MDEGTIWGIINDWWAFAAFVAGGVIAFLMGQERRRYRVDDLARKVERLDEDVRDLKAQGSADAVTLAEIRVQLKTIISALSDIREDVKGKADKT